MEDLMERKESLPEIGQRKTARQIYTGLKKVKQSLMDDPDYNYHSKLLEIY